MTTIAEVVASLNRMRQFYPDGDDHGVLRIIGTRATVESLAKELGLTLEATEQGFSVLECPVTIDNRCPPETLFIVDQRYCDAAPR